MDKKIDWEKVREERRAKILWLDEDQMLDFIATSRKMTRVTRIALPDNCRVHSVYTSYSRQAFGFVILSDEFEPNPKGMRLQDTDMAGLRACYVDGVIEAKDEKPE